jgi:hypothetical protein
MTKQKGIKFVKVETDRPLLTFYPAKYDFEPRLYMEMLENTSKVKPTLRNTEWISKNNSSLSVSMNDNKINENSYNDPKSKSPSKSPSTSKKQKIIDITNASENDLKNFDNRITERTSYGDKPDDLDNLTGSIKFGFKNRLKQKRDERRDDDKDDRRSRDDDKDERRSRDDDKDDRRSRDDDRDERRSRDDDRDERRSRDNDRDERRSRDDDRDERRSRDEIKKDESPLSKMLKGEVDESPREEVKSPSQQLPQQQQVSNVPPSLSEITEGRVQVDSNGIRSLDYITTDERDEQEKKRDLLNKFAKLKKEYHNAHVPNHTEHTDLITLQKDYTSIKKQLEIDAKALRYKQWLLYSFLGLEILLLNFGSFDDIRGFYNYQKNCINQYESLLFELGEKNYIQDEKKWPVEIRLVGVVAMNAAFFIGGKWAERKYGVNILTLFNPMNIPPPPPQQQYQPQAQPQAQPQQQFQPRQQSPVGFTPFVNPPQQKPKMRGPEFDFEDISSKKTN